MFSSESDEMYFPQLYQSPDRKILIAILEEMKFFNQIMTEHAMLMRNTFDLTEEDFFRAADSFAVHLNQLLMEVRNTPENAPDRVFQCLVDQSLVLVTQLRDFKVFLYDRLLKCQTLSILPPILIDHIRREADFYLSILHRFRGQETATRERVGIPDSGRRLESIPIELISSMPPEQQIQIAFEETLFWSRIHMEHAAHLSMTFTPSGQERYIRAALQFQNDFNDHIQQTLAVERSRGEIRQLNRETIKLTSAWRDYLIQTFEDIRTCRIPHRHTNFHPALADHMRREAQYLIDAVEQVRVR